MTACSSFTVGVHGFEEMWRRMIRCEYVSQRSYGSSILIHNSLLLFIPLKLPDKTVIPFHQESLKSLWKFHMVQNTAAHLLTSTAHRKDITVCSAVDMDSHLVSEFKCVHLKSLHDLKPVYLTIHHAIRIKFIWDLWYCKFEKFLLGMLCLFRGPIWWSSENGTSLTT